MIEQKAVVRSSEDGSIFYIVSGFAQLAYGPPGNVVVITCVVYIWLDAADHASERSYSALAALISTHSILRHVLYPQFKHFGFLQMRMVLVLEAWNLGSLNLSILLVRKSFCRHAKHVF